MMILSTAILAIIQGITEFLPISSSAHLVLVHHFLNDAAFLSDLDQKRMDIAVHIGTLMAVCLYFRQDLLGLIVGGFKLLTLDLSSENARKALLVTLSSLPVITCGLVIFLIDITIFDSLEIIGWTSIIFGIILYFADKRPQSSTTVENFTIKTALIYGLAQCIALIPGVSRSGITMTTGRFLGHSRTEAARFSLLMGIVTIAAAGTLTGLSLFKDSQVTADFIKELAVGITLSFITAYITIIIMMRWISKRSFMPFVIYRIILGIILLILLYSGIVTENV